MNCISRRPNVISGASSRAAQLGVLCIAGMLLAVKAPAQEPEVIELTQVPCQFVESENGINHSYESMRKTDCEAINNASGSERLAASTTITLKPGKYVFRVTNESVPYDLGFWLRGDGLINRTTLPSVSGGGLKQGMSKDYEIELKPGEYVYSCPLNSTPDYKLVVEG